MLAQELEELELERQNLTRLVMEKNVLKNVKDEFLDDLKECNADKTDFKTKLQKCEGTTVPDKGTTSPQVIVVSAGFSLAEFILFGLIVSIVGFGTGLFIKRSCKGTKSGDEEAQVEDTQINGVSDDHEDDDSDSSSDEEDEKELTKDSIELKVQDSKVQRSDEKI